MFCRGLDRLQFLPARVKLREIFLRGGEVGGELAGLGGVRAMKIRRGEQGFDAGDFRLHALDLRFHAFQLARFLERQFAGLGRFRCLRRFRSRSS